MEKVLVKMKGIEKIKAAKKIMEVSNTIVKIAREMYENRLDVETYLDPLYNSICAFKRMQNKYEFDAHSALSHEFDDELDFASECLLFGKYVNEEKEDTENA